MLSLFYLTGSTFVIPAVMLTRKIAPKWTVPWYIFGWGFMATINAACTNYAGVMMVRIRQYKRFILTLT